MVRSKHVSHQNSKQVPIYMMKSGNTPTLSLGRKVFSNGKEELNYSLKPGESVTFRYRIVVHSGKFFTNDDMNKLFADFKETK